MTKIETEHPKTVSRAEWLVARKKLLIKEKEMTRARDELSAERRQLPWVRVEKEYLFDTVNGEKDLADLFDGRTQLVVQHFMLGPGWEEGCVGCSFFADHVEGALVHLEHHDVTFVAISRAPLPEIESFKKRMGWRFNWVSSNRNEFNYDYHVSFPKDRVVNGKVYYNYEMCDFAIDELPGLSVFYKNEAGEIFHTYSSYARGGEVMLGAYNFLDLVPNGRDENGPSFTLMDWVRHHDRYDAAVTDEPTGQYVLSNDSGTCCSSSI
jgi:predicted dithiol-disulfide oxidoreductase (DUF899 family)